MKMDEWVLAEQNYKFIRSRKWDAAVLTFGATEPHNYHMPYGTDNIQVQLVGRRACERAYRKGANVLLLPNVPFGVNTNHMQIPGGLSLSVTPTTLLKIISDIVESLSHHGVRKLLLLNGHGGNELKPLARELHHRTDVFICVCDWFHMAADQFSKIFKSPGEHADEVETSMGLAFFPELMKMEQAGSGAKKATRFAAIEKGWISISRPWHLLTEDTGVGDPSAATAEKGRKLMEILTERLGDFLYELAKSPMDEKFPF
jgi:creatinine amidohydrolase